VAEGEGKGRTITASRESTPLKLCRRFNKKRLLVTRKLLEIDAGTMSILMAAESMGRFDDASLTAPSAWRVARQGLHASIVDDDLWSRVQDSLAEQTQRRKPPSEDAHSFFVWKLFDDRGHRMGPSHVGTPKGRPKSLDCVKSNVFDAADFTIRTDGVCRLNPEMARMVVATVESRQ
jgi:hypothetical protein